MNARRKRPTFSPSVEAASRKPAPAKRRVKAKLVEITITGTGQMPSVAEVFAHCVHLAAQGKSAKLTTPGITATVTVSK